MKLMLTKTDTTTDLENQNKIIRVCTVGSFKEAVLKRILECAKSLQSVSPACLGAGSCPSCTTGHEYAVPGDGSAFPHS